MNTTVKKPVGVVGLGAMGMGADDFHGVIENTAVFSKVKTIAGL